MGSGAAPSPQAGACAITAAIARSIRRAVCLWIFASLVPRASTSGRRCRRAGRAWHPQSALLTGFTVRVSLRLLRQAELMAIEGASSERWQRWTSQAVANTAADDLRTVEPTSCRSSGSPLDETLRPVKGQSSPVWR